MPVQEHYICEHCGGKIPLPITGELKKRKPEKEVTDYEDKDFEDLHKSHNPNRVGDNGDDWGH